VKVGDLVKLAGMRSPMNSGAAGVIVRIFEKKCWRTQERGPMVDWTKIDPEPHAEVIINGNMMNFPVSELECV